MKQSDAISYLLVHFAKRVKSNRRDTILASKTIRYKGLAPSTVNFYEGYETLKKTLRNEHDLVSHLASFIQSPNLQAGILCHCAEVVVTTRDYPIDDMKLLLHAGRTMKMTDDTINNILHVVLWRESLASVMREEMWEN